ncbi:MAG: hypothetical protein ACAH80_06800 [Alphaproteobacteria bacterium]
MRKLWLTPVFTLAAFFGGAAMAQETPAVPAPQIDAQWKVQPDTKLDLTLTAPKYKYDSTEFRLAPMPKEFDGRPSGFVGRAVEFFDEHSVKGDSMFDTALEKDIGGGFSIAAGSVDMRKSSGPQAAARQTARIMTGLPDSETRELRRALAGGMPREKHGDGVGVAIRFRIGLK